jgi:N4-gp56 family major capsid protein
MAIQTYVPGSAASGNPTNVHSLGRILKSIDTYELLDRLVKTFAVPMNKNETITMTRAVTPDARVEEVAEGVNPASRALVYESVSKTMQEFAEVFTVSSRQAELGEQNVLMDSKDRLVDLVKRTRERNAWFEYRGTGTQRIFNSSAHANRNQVNGPLTLGRIRVAVRTLTNNKAVFVRQAANGSVNQGTTAMEAAFICIVHTDAQADIRNIPGFVPLAQIGGAARDIKGAFGQVDNVLFLTSQEFAPFFGEGAAVGATNMLSSGGVNVDVYPYVFFGAEALAKLSLRGKSASGMGGMKIDVLDGPDKSDPTNQRRLVACRWWDAPVIAQQLHVVTIECGVTANIA